MTEEHVASPLCVSVHPMLYLENNIWHWREIMLHGIKSVFWEREVVGELKYASKNIFKYFQTFLLYKLSMVYESEVQNKVLSLK